MKTPHAMITPADPLVIVERRAVDLVEVPEHKRSWWRPVVEVGNDAFDPATHVKTGPVTTIETTRVVDTWTIRAKTAEEIDADKEERLDRYDRLNFEINYDQESRIRVLESRPAINRVQYRAALKARL